MIKRILVALSGSPYTPTAIHHALDLARQHDAVITGVTIADTKRLQDVGPVPMGGGAAAHALAEHRLHLTEERIENTILAFQAACDEQGRTHRVVRETGDVLDELIACWRYHDLTISGLRDLFEYGVVHHPDDWVLKILSKGVRPIIAVPEDYRPVRRVFIAYSGSMASAKTMKRFVQMRLWPDVQLRIACFDRHAEASGLLANAAEYCRAHGYDPETIHFDGPAHKGLLREASEWNADIVVMGSTSRGRLSKLILGDTAREAMLHADVPLYLAQ